MKRTTIFEMSLFAHTPFGAFYFMKLDALLWYVHAPRIGIWPDVAPFMNPGRYRMLPFVSAAGSEIITLTSDVCDVVVEMRPPVKSGHKLPVVHVGYVLVGDAYCWRLQYGVDAFNDLRAIMCNSDLAYIMVTQPVLSGGK